MQDDAILRQHAREALREGRLPDRRPDRIWGGNGMSTPCRICDDRIGSDETELEIEFDGDGGNDGIACFHIHLCCFAAWEMERTEITLESEPTRSAVGTCLPYTDVG